VLHTLLAPELPSESLLKAPTTIFRGKRPMISFGLVLLPLHSFQCSGTFLQEVTP
jgi:hypothetical protein